MMKMMHYATLLLEALKPNQRFWLLQLFTVPMLALMGAMYIVADVHAMDYNALPHEDYVTQQPSAYMLAATETPPVYSPIPAMATQAPAYKVHFDRYEFPTQFFGGAPSDPIKLTMFQEHLYNETLDYPTLEMTNHLEHTEYRVEIECAGLLLCSRLQLNIYDVHRNFLSSLQIPRAHLIVNDENLKDEAENIVHAVNKRLLAFPAGGFGTYDEHTGAL